MNTYWEELELPGGRRLVRDEAYGFLKVMPRPTDQELAPYYADVYRNPCVPHDPNGRAEIVCELASRPGRVLEIGCGGGEFLASFRDRGWKTLGVEPGRQHAEQARRRGIEVIERPLTDDLIKHLGSFDAVLLIHVLEHMIDPEEMLRMIHKLLKPGGIFFCEVPNDFSPLQEAAVAVRGLRPWWVVLPDHLNYFSVSTLSAFVAGNGFDVVVRTTDFPVEMFLLWGDIYVDDPEVGSWMHARRCRFEEAMRQAGKGKLLRDMYESMAALEIGREAVVCARKHA